jgi:hypothetical protein
MWEPQRLTTLRVFTACYMHSFTSFFTLNHEWQMNIVVSTSMISTTYCFFFNLRIVGGGVQTGSTRHVGHLLAYCTCPGWLWGCRIWCNKCQGKPKYSEKTCPGSTLSSTNPTWPDPGLNPGRRGGKPATNRSSYPHIVTYSVSVPFKVPSYV